MIPAMAVTNAPPSANINSTYEPDKTPNHINTPQPNNAQTLPNLATP